MIQVINGHTVSMAHIWNSPRPHYEIMIFFADGEMSKYSEWVFATTPEELQQVFNAFIVAHWSELAPPPVMDLTRQELHEVITTAHATADHISYDDFKSTATYYMSDYSFIRVDFKHGTIDINHFARFLFH